MLWAKVGEALVDLEEVQALTVGETVEGKFTLVIVFKNGQSLSFGNYSDREEALKELTNLLIRLKSLSPKAVLT
ncbi:MAG: hypothetical protein PVTTEEND_002159 [Candidatus Fervidibacter sp.]